MQVNFFSSDQLIAVKPSVALLSVFLSVACNAKAMEPMPLVGHPSQAPVSLASDLTEPGPSSESAVFTPNIEQDAPSNRKAAWEESDGVRFNVWTKRSVAGISWGAAQPIGRLANITPFNASAPQVALNTLGKVIAVWQQVDGTQTRVWASQRSADSSWAHAAHLCMRAGSGDSLNPTLAVDARGQAAALWQQADGTRNTTWARPYNARLGWGRPILVDSQFAAQDMVSAPLTQYSPESVAALRKPMSVIAHK